MARPKTIQQAGENLRQVAPLIGARYITGINNADWQGPASSEQAEQNYSTGVQRAVADGTRRAGILDVTNQQWQQAAVSKGGGVIGQRIADAVPKSIQNFGPILAAMSQAQANLPPRTTSASQNVTNRLLPIIRSAMEAAGKSYS